MAFSLLNFTLFFFENLWEKEACSVINRAESLCLEKYLLMLFFLSSLDSSFFPFFLLPPFPPQPVGKCCSSSSSPPLRHLRFPTHKRDKKSFFSFPHRRPPREGGEHFHKIVGVGGGEPGRTLIFIRLTSHGADSFPCNRCSVKKKSGRAVN